VGIPKENARTLPVTPTAASAGLPGGSVVVEFTCAAFSVGTASISDLSPLN
jgi:hypothetical protein